MKLLIINLFLIGIKILFLIEIPIKLISKIKKNMFMYL